MKKEEINIQNLTKINEEIENEEEKLLEGKELLEKEEIDIVEKEKIKRRIRKKYRLSIMAILTYLITYLILQEPFIRTYEKVDNYVGTFVIIVLVLLIVEAFINNVYKEIDLIWKRRKENRNKCENKKEIKNIQITNVTITILSSFLAWMGIVYYLGVLLKESKLAEINYFLYIQVIGVLLALTNYVIAIPMAKKALAYIALKQDNKRREALKLLRVLMQLIIRTTIMIVLLIASMKALDLSLDFKQKYEQIEQNWINEKFSK